MSLLLGRNPIGFALRIALLPLAVPILLLMYLTTGALNPAGNAGGSFLSFVVQYITGDPNSTVAQTLHFASGTGVVVGAQVIPVKVRIALSLITGAASVLNLTTFGIGGSAAIYISAALAFFAYIGIPPVTGNAFQNLLMQLFPAKWVQTVHGVVGAVIMAVDGLVTQAHWSAAVSAIVVGLVTELGALGFGPMGTAPVVAVPK